MPQRPEYHLPDGKVKSESSAEYHLSADRVILGVEAEFHNGAWQVISMMPVESASLPLLLLCLKKKKHSRVNTHAFNTRKFFCNDANYEFIPSKTLI